MTIESKQERDTPGKVRQDLEDRIEKLESLVAVMAHQSGVPNSTLLERNIKPYELKPKDMRKYA